MKVVQDGIELLETASRSMCEQVQLLSVDHAECVKRHPELVERYAAVSRGKLLGVMVAHPVFESLRERIKVFMMNMDFLCHLIGFIGINTALRDTAAVNTSALIANMRTWKPNLLSGPLCSPAKHASHISGRLVGVSTAVACGQSLSTTAPPTSAPR